MNRIIRFNIINHADTSAGFYQSDNDVEIKLDWPDEDMTDVIEAFRETLRDLFDTSDVATDDEREEQYRKQNEAWPADPEDV